MFRQVSLQSPFYFRHKEKVISAEVQLKTQQNQLDVERFAEVSSVSHSRLNF